ncbi:hypothetical protein ES702_00547 [subsurface metagenome]
MCPRKLRRLPRQTVWVDNKGRFTIPEYLREAAGINKESWVEVEAYPELEKCKYLAIKRAF